MKKMRILSVLLILCCLMTLIPVQAYAQEEKSKGGKLIALTFDDGPGYYTASLLDGLAERGVKATFFMLGECAENYPETVRRVFNEGHEIAQHTYSHPALTTKSNEQIRWQLDTTDQILDECIGMDLDYILRPPYGDRNDRVLSVIGCPSIIWSVDSRDWESLNSYSVCNTIVNNSFDGAIVLVHDIHRTSVPGALMAVDELLDRGYEFVTVSELYRRRGQPLEDGKNYFYCKPNGIDDGPLQAPEISSRIVAGACEITMTTGSNAPIWYSLDGSFPNQLYTGPILTDRSVSVSAVTALAVNRGRSDITKKEITYHKLETPVLYSEKGFFYYQAVEQGVIRYTNDGSSPVADSYLYEQGIPWFNGTLSSFVVSEDGSSDYVVHHVSENGNIFADVSPEYWYFDEIDRAATMQWLQGEGNYIYRPDGNITRSAFVTLLYRIVDQLGYDVSYTIPANNPDLQKDSWYFDAISWASEKGILTGYPDTSMRPEAYITREMMCAIMERLFVYLEMDVPEAEPAFADNDTISPWAYSSVGSMAGMELILGRGENIFAPLDNATRAEAVTILLRLYDMLYVEVEE
ncbi:MAG: polysaccharide deacetylase family protein [Oscillospiraceae bacterium]|nr:polysaccharide deacetylase family protein [Oscillospiraceae bacterium]